MAKYAAKGEPSFKTNYHQFLTPALITMVRTTIVVLLQYKYCNVMLC